MSTFFDPTLVARASKAGFNVIDNAVYTPAVQTMYINAIEQEMSKDRPFPEGYGLEDLIFWEPGNRVLDWPFVLHSAGHYSPYSDKQNLLTNGSTQNRFLIADSSGYQFSSNSLQFKEFKDKSKKWTPLEALQAWDSSLKEKEFLLYWMERNATYSTVLDAPPWGKLPMYKGAPFHECSFDQFLEITKQNMEWIHANRLGHTKFLCVIQGYHTPSTKKWIDAMTAKDYRFEGVSAGGGSGFRGGFKEVLSTVMMLKERDFFLPGQDLAHFLGVSTAIAAVALSHIQKRLREKNPALTVTFDSSSPFLTGGRYERGYEVAQLNKDGTGWGLSAKESPQNILHVNSKEPFGRGNPFAGDSLQLGHFNVVDAEVADRRFDSISNALLMLLNVNAFLRTFEKANALANDSLDNLPVKYRDCIHIIDEAFDSNNWQAVLDKHEDRLNLVASSQFYDKEGDLLVDWP
jgi:hypothetical protein